MVLENRGLNGKKEEYCGKKLHKYELNDLWSSSNITRMNKYGMTS
jgi:hypothetical protein